MQEFPDAALWSKPVSAAGRQGRLADYQTRLDFVVLDELGYMPFAQAGGLLLFHLVSRLYERISILVTTNLAFGDAAHATPMVSRIASGWKSGSDFHDPVSPISLPDLMEPRRRIGAELEAIRPRGA